MNKVGKKLIWFAAIMIISFIVSGFFFLKSGLIHLGTGEVNTEVVIELDKASHEFNVFFGIPVENRNCYMDWCLEEGTEVEK